MLTRPLPCQRISARRRRLAYTMRCFAAAVPRAALALPRKAAPCRCPGNDLPDHATTMLCGTWYRPCELRFADATLRFALPMPIQLRPRVSSRRPASPAHRASPRCLTALSQRASRPFSAMPSRRSALPAHCSPPPDYATAFHCVACRHNALASRRFTMPWLPVALP